MKHKYSIAVLVAILICNFTQAQIKTPGQIIGEVENKITRISVEDFKSKIESEDKFILLDVRTEKEYLAGHIKNAVWLPRGFIEFKIQKLVDDPETEIILYCKRGSRSALTAYTLLGMGYKNVLNLEGGFEQWVVDGNSIYNEHGELQVINFEKQEEE
ncbi:MAG: rhodanese-like domain-containing protein [Ignavibacteriaceae bacterium]|jgi:rhodanese-related sulfurtransferase|nr:rhodanese-like domain-containing protein [Ignavibacteriaceae bacterium]